MEFKDVKVGQFVAWVAYDGAKSGTVAAIHGQDQSYAQQFCADDGNRFVLVDFDKDKTFTTESQAWHAYAGKLQKDLSGILANAQKATATALERAGAEAAAKAKEQAEQNSTKVSINLNESAESLSA